MHDFDELSIPATDERRPMVVHRSSPMAWVLTVLAVAAGGAGAYLLLQQRDQARAETETARKATNDVAQNLHLAEEAKRALEGDVARLAEQGRSLAAERDVLHQSVEAKDAELAQLKTTSKTLEDKLAAEIKKGDVHVSEVNGKIRVDLVDQILFESGQAGLSGRGAEVLGRVAAVLTQLADRQIQVSGHTDDSPISDRLAGTYPTNWELSVMRAVNVVRQLSEHGGVPAQRLVATGYGPYEPISPNTTPQGRARNRRIEILLMPPLSAKPLGGTAALASAKEAPSAPAAAPASKKPASRKGASRLAGASASRHPRGR